MSLALFDLTGRRALVTGSGQGIGLALATGLGRAGAEIVLNGRDRARLDAALPALREAGITASASAFDVTDHDAVVAAVTRIETELGAIDILVNNAGIQRRGALEDYPVETWHEILRANLDSVFYVGQAVARHMIPRGRGKIINVASLQSEASRFSIAPYAATKGAVKMLTKGMCTDWARHNIQVNGIGPGYFATPLNQALIDNPEFDAWLKKRTPAGRWGRVEELQGAAIFLASAASDFVNGQIVYVDGGVLATL
jgi:gluconate 5-dehydrogenase